MVANQRLVAHAVPGINAAGVPEVGTSGKKSAIFLTGGPDLGTSVTVTMKVFHVDVENFGKYS